MSEMIACEVEFEMPSSQALSPLFLQKNLIQTLGKNLVAVAQIDFHGNLSGSALMLFSCEAADALVLALNGDGDVASEEFKQEKADIMGEIGNLAIGGIVGSTAKIYGAGVLGVVLTGMGQDGLLGCQNIREAGGKIIVQDQASSVVWGMPGSVVNSGFADRVVSLQDMAAEIIDRVMSQ